MRKLALVVGGFVLTMAALGTAAAQSAPPSTDIYLAPLREHGDRILVGTPVNITARPGYDNQPSFTLDGRALLFTSVREGAQADIYRYDLRTKATTRVTSTPESEYSATVYGDGNRFSVIRVEADSTQRLWSFDLSGRNPRLVFDAIKPVGYHAWVDSTTIALFLLGRPNALVLADSRVGRADTIARDIGRSLLPLPRGGGFSFLQHAKDSSWILTAVDVRGSRENRSAVPMPLVRMPGGADYVVWLAPAVAITGTGSKLLIWRGSSTASRWMDLIDLGKYGLSHISRLAISPDHSMLAIVAEPATGAR